MWCGARDDDCDILIHMSPRRQSYPADHGSHLPILIGIGTKARIRRVLEMGSGSFSTPLFLNRGVFPDLVELVSVERDPEWTQKTLSSSAGDTRITLTPDEPVDRSKFDLIFIDSAHGVERVEALKQLAAQTAITGLVVIHDSEVPLYREQFNLFPNCLDITAYDPSTAVLWHGHATNESIRAMLRDIDTVVNRYADCPPDDVAAWLGRFRNPAPARLTVSVAMTAYRRHEQLRNTFETFLWQTRLPDQIVVVEDGYDGGLTENVCKEFAGRLPVEWVCRRNRPQIAFSNPAIPRNIGIRRATGDIVVIQNPEVRFTKPTDFANVVAPTEADAIVSTCAPCESLHEDGTHRMWYCDPKIVGNINCFCQAFRRAHLVALGGFDETFRGYG